MLSRNLGVRPALTTFAMIDEQKRRKAASGASFLAEFLEGDPIQSRPTAQ